MVLYEQDISRIKQLRKDNKSGSKISKEIGKRKQDVLSIIRELEGKIKVRSSKLIYTPIKYLKPKQKERKEKIIKVIRERKEQLKPLSNKEKKFIKENVEKNESDYKIRKEFKGREKKVIKEIKKAKNKIKKNKLRVVNKESGFKCKFNYITQHHIGYQFEQQSKYPIFQGITDKEINNIIKDIQNILKILNSKVRCLQRINYASLEYEITLTDKSKEKSKNSTNINGEYGISSFNETLRQIPEIVMYLVNLVHQAQSTKLIEIYNIIYVNYDFKNNVKGNLER